MSTGQKQDMFVLDARGWMWSEIIVQAPPPTLTIKSSKHASFMHESSLYIFGGDHGQGSIGNGDGCSNQLIRASIDLPGRKCAFAAVDVCNADEKAELPGARVGHTLSRQGVTKCWLLFGGTDGQLTYFNDVWKLEPPPPQSAEDQKWVWTKVPPGPNETLPKGREWHNAVWAPSLEELVIFGGCLGADYTNEVCGCKFEETLGAQVSKACSIL